MAMVSLPGSTPEKFHFTVWDDKVAEKVNQAMGKRVSLRYEQKVGIPTRCFGDTRYYVTEVQVVEVIPLTPGFGEQRARQRWCQIWGATPPAATIRPVPPLFGFRFREASQRCVELPRAVEGGR